MEIRKDKFRTHAGVEIKQRREMHSVQLRKANRCTLIVSKRNKLNEAVDTKLHYDLLMSIDQRLYDESTEVQMEVMKSLLESYKNDCDVICALFKKLRTDLSCNDKVKFEIAYNKEFIPILVTFIASYNSTISFEAIWSLINLAAMDKKYSEEIIRCKGHIKIYQQINNEELLENSIWLLTNLIEDSKETRNVILTLGFINKLIQVLKQKSIKISLLRTITWSLSCIMKEESNVEVEDIITFIKLSETLIELEDQEVTQSILRTFYNLTLTDKHFISSFVNLLPFPIILSQATKEHLLALKVFGNLCQGPQCFTEIAVRANIIQAIKSLLVKEGSTEIVMEVTWIVANIVYNAEECIEELFKMGIVDELYKFLYPGVHSDIKDNVISTIVNICINGSLSQRQRIAEGEGLLALILMLDERNDIGLLKKVLEGIESLLSIYEGEYENIYAMRFDSIGGVERLEDLQMNSDMEVFKRTQAILDQYYYSDQTELDFVLATSQY